MIKWVLCFWVLLFSFMSSAGEFLKLKTQTVRLPIWENQVSTLFSQAESEWQSKKVFVIQFKNPIREETKKLLESAGLETNGYLPDDALIVKASAIELKRAHAFLEEIQGAAPFQAEWKLDPSLFGNKNTLSPMSRTLLHIRLLSADDQPGIKHTLDRFPEVTVHAASGKSIVAESTESGLYKIARLEGVEWIQALPIMVLLDMNDLDPNADTPTPPNPPAPPPLTGYESGTKVMGFEEAWAKGFNGKGQVVASADSGVDMGDVSRLHRDLSQVIKGYPMGMMNTSWADPMGHGTHVCGSVVSTGAASEEFGDKRIRGGAHGAQFVAEGMWNSVFNNLIVESNFDVLMGTPYRDGARVHTNSWGSPLNPGAYDNFAAMADEVSWNRPDLLVLFAAGNDGQDKNKDGRVDEGSIATPGTAKNVLTVGASENLLSVGGIQKKLCDLKEGQKKWGAEPLCSDTLSNNPNGLAAFSSRGPTQDGRLKPEIVAPGTNIVSVRSQHPTAKKLWGEYNADYLYSGGTSMATPLAAGAAVAARQFLVEARQISNPSAALVKALLIHTAKDLYPGQYGMGPTQELQKPRPNPHEGYGRVDMESLTSLSDEVLSLDDQTGLALNETKKLQVELPEGGKLRATLVYTDAPAKAGAAKALVNDLDLSVQYPSGASVGLNDHTNNSEMLELTGLSAGSYQVIVTAKNVPQGKNGKQPFALLVERLQ